jgi:hypothetical protein
VLGREIVLLICCYLKHSGGNASCFVWSIAFAASGWGWYAVTGCGAVVQYLYTKPCSAALILPTELALGTS